MNVEELHKRLSRALKMHGGLYTWTDIMERIEDGRMQSFCEGDTWVVTQVNVFPRKKVLDVVFFVGELRDMSAVEGKVVEFAKEVGADMIMATGRIGWDKVKPAGWKLVSNNYIREIRL